MVLKTLPQIAAEIAAPLATTKKVKFKLRKKNLKF